jgi:hypothetical protein
MGRGALTFKGETKAAKSKRKRVQQQEAKEAASQSDSAAVPLSMTHGSLEPKRPETTTAAASETTVALSSQQQPQMKRGSGTITISGTVVTGHNTRFLKEMGVGDALIVNVPKGKDNDNGITEQQEMRVVTMRLSDISLNLSSAFSANIPTPVPYSFIRKPRDVAQESRVAQERATQQQLDEQRHRGDGDEAAGELVYRERTEHGNYRTKRVKVDGAQNRSDLLQLRTKKTSDKYC